MGPTRLSATIALALGMALTACGDDDADATLSTSEYRDAGNDVCQDVDAEVSAILGGGPPTVEAVQTDLAPRLSAALDTLGGGLRGLEPPSELADTHQQLLDAIADAVNTLAGAVNDDELAARLTAEGPPMDELDELAAELGLTACTADG